MYIHTLVLISNMYIDPLLCVVVPIVVAVIG